MCAELQTKPAKYREHTGQKQEEENMLKVKPGVADQDTTESDLLRESYDDLHVTLVPYE